MSIVHVVDHLYELRKEDHRITIHFSTNRFAWFIPVFVVFGLCFFVVWIAVHLGWNGNLISGLIGGSISMIAVTCFAVAEHITRYVITIEPDVVCFQKTFEGIPVGAGTVYSRQSLMDLGVYPYEVREPQPRSQQLGKLCIWSDGKSIEIEEYFPLSEAAALARDLRAMGIEFPRTQPEFEERLALGGCIYLSF